MGAEIRCGKCKTIVVSRHRHDFVSCGCPVGTFVDGGDDYLRCGGNYAEVRNKETGEWESVFKAGRDRQQKEDRGPMWY